MPKTLRRIAFRLTAVLTVITASLTLATPAQASPFWAWGVNLNSRICMGVSGGIMTPGRPVIQWQCNGNPDQSWGPMVNYRMNDTQALTNKQDPSYCLSVANNSLSQGAALVITPCDGGTTQQWTITWMATPLGTFATFTNVHSGLVAAVGAASKNQGTPIVQWAFQGTSHYEQFWNQ